MQTLNLFKRKLIIVGHAEHGKDTVAEMLKYYFGLKYRGSSIMAAELFIFDALKDRFKYTTPLECYNDRMSPEMRTIWHDMIKDYNKDDKARLCKEIFKTADAYLGMRCREELAASKLLKDENGNTPLVIWVDAIGRKPMESENSCTITMDQADIVINNNRDRAALASMVRNQLRHVLLDLETGKLDELLYLE